MPAARTAVASSPMWSRSAIQWSRCGLGTSLRHIRNPSWCFVTGTTYRAPVCWNSGTHEAVSTPAERERNSSTKLA